ncbi:MAG: hypothetical protein FJ405_11735 [Verrucomicrobia bacterium]|nr:hypothetical protein [Verrucomicrobiota bacterium]
MSQRDIDQNRELVLSFRGRRCFATLATNSIRFRVDAEDKKGRYIWIDPPWVLSCGWDEIAASEDYSEDTEDSFREWCTLFEPLRDTVLEQFDEGADGSATFIFRGDYRLVVPDNGEREEDMDYDHWYALDGRT